jgi:multidrug efflux system membrane fusion protein
MDLRIPLMKKTYRTMLRSNCGLRESLLPAFRTAGLLSLVAIFAAGCAKQSAAPAFDRPPAPVTAATALAQDVPIYFDEVGRGVARETVSVQPQVSGRITEIHFEDGANLKKGDLLFTIDPRPFQAQLDAATANVAQAKAAQALAKLNFERANKLFSSGVIAQQDFDTSKNAQDVTAAQVAQNEAAVETAKLNLEYTAIRSPIDGRAGHRLVDMGNIVTANNSTLLTIERMDPIYAEFTVTESELAQVQSESSKGALRVEVSIPDDSGKPIVGQMTYLDNIVQTTTGTVLLRATVPNPDRRLWPGEFVKVRLVLRTLPKAVLIPATAPQQSAKGTFVYVVKGDSTAEARPVDLGQRQGEQIVVNKGVQPGEQVITNGQIAVTPGGKVRVADENATGAPPAAAPKPGGQS